jgi:hypothetical protein
MHNLFFLCLLSISSLRDDPAALRALASFYETNRVGFGECRIDFDYKDAFANSIQDAVLDDVRDAHIAQGIIAFKNKSFLYTCVFTDDAMKATASSIGPGQTKNRLNCVRLLTDGKVTLRDNVFAGPDSAILRGSSIVAGTLPFFKVAEIPLSIGVPANYREDINTLCQMIENRTLGVTLESVEENVTMFSINTIKISINTPDGRSIFWVDPEHGAIPILTRYEGPGDSICEIQLGDLHFYPGHGWFPQLRTTLLPGGRVKRMAIRNAKFADIHDDLFHLEFPNPIRMMNMAANVVHPPQRVWDLSKLPSASLAGTTPLTVIPPAAEPEMPGEIEPVRPYFTIAAICLAAFFVVIFLLRRRRVTID